MFDRYDLDIIGVADAAVCMDLIFWHQKQGNAFRPGGPIGRAGEDQMDDILRHVMVAKADINLRAFNVVSAITAWGRGRLQRADVGPGLRLGQVHRA